MAFNPCCCSLQRGTKILAIIDVIINLIAVGIMVLLIAALLIVDRTSENFDMENSEWAAALAFMIVLAIVYLLHVILAFMLYFGAKRRDYRRCRNWLIIVGILTLISVISTIINEARFGFTASSFAISGVGWLYSFYEMIVVFAFLKEMKRDAEMQRNSFENPGSGLQYMSTAPYYGQNYGLPPSSYGMQQYPQNNSNINSKSPETNF